MLEVIELAGVKDVSQKPRFLRVQRTLASLGRTLTSLGLPGPPWASLWASLGRTLASLGLPGRLSGPPWVSLASLWGLPWVSLTPPGASLGPPLVSLGSPGSHWECSGSR